MLALFVFSLGTPLCFPESFKEAELQYTKFASEDDLQWILHGKESKLIRESAVLDEDHRLNSPLYRRCYQKYNIYDCLQYTIVFHQKLLGVLTLFRTRPNGIYTSDEVYSLRAIVMHLNPVLHRIFTEKKDTKSSDRFNLPLIDRYQLTAKEEEILKYLLEFKDNEEIAEHLGIRKTTLNKHLQNLFRRMEVHSRWELLRKIHNESKEGNYR